MTKIKIIGLGNSFCGDDAVGVLIAQQLLSYSSIHVSIVEGGLTGLNLLHEMEKIDTLILLDAVHSHSQIGTIHYFRVPQDLVTFGKLAWSSSGSSTHSFALAEALTLAHTLKVLPQNTIIYGIELGHIQKGLTLSPAVSQAMQNVVNQIIVKELSLSHA